MKPVFVITLVIFSVHGNLWASVPTGETVRILLEEENRISLATKTLVKDLSENVETLKSEANYSLYRREFHRLKQSLMKGEIPFIQSCLTATPEHFSYVLNRIQGFAYRQPHSEDDLRTADVKTQLARLQLLSDQRSEVQSWLRGFQETSLCSQRAESRSP